MKLRVSNISSQPTASGGGWTQVVSPLFIPVYFRPWICKRHLPSQVFICWVFGVCLGFACVGCV